MNEIQEVVLDIVDNPYLDTDEQLSQLVSVGKPIHRFLLTALDRPDNVRLFNISVRALSLMGSWSVASEVIRKLQSKNQVTRLHAARILVSIGEDAIPHIRNEYRNGGKRIRLMLLKILGSIQSSDSLDILEEAVKSRDTKVRAAAAGALIQVGFPGILAIIVSLEDMTGVDFSDSRIRNILRGGRIAAAHLATIIQDSNTAYRLRRKAATLLGNLSDFGTLNSLYSQNHGPEIKKLVLIALEEIPQSEKIVLFRKAIFHNDKFTLDKQVGLNVSEQAVISLANSVFDVLSDVAPMTIDENALDRISEFSQDTSFEVRKASYRILCYMRDHHSLQLLTMLVLQSQLSITKRVEVIAVFVHFWLTRGIPDFVTRLLPSELQGAIRTLHQHTKYYEGH